MLGQTLTQPSMASSLLMILSMWLLLSCSEGREYLVGGNQSSWKVPLPSPDSLSQWAQSHRFRIGDALIFEYDNRRESVHVVDEEDYSKCKTKGEQHVVFNDGNTKVVFNKSGPLHFITGTQAHCHMGLKVAVVVMSDKHKHSSPSPSPSPIPPANQAFAPPSSGAGFIICLFLIMIFFF